MLIARPQPQYCLPGLDFSPFGELMKTSRIQVLERRYWASMEDEDLGSRQQDKYPKPRSGRQRET